MRGLAGGREIQRGRLRGNHGSGFRLAGNQFRPPAGHNAPRAERGSEIDVQRGTGEFPRALAEMDRTVEAHHAVFVAIVQAGRGNLRGGSGSDRNASCGKAVQGHGHVVLQAHHGMARVVGKAHGAALSIRKRELHRLIAVGRAGLALEGHLRGIRADHLTAGTRARVAFRFQLHMHVALAQHLAAIGEIVAFAGVDAVAAVSALAEDGDGHVLEHVAVALGECRGVRGLHLKERVLSRSLGKRELHGLLLHAGWHGGRRGAHRARLLHRAPHVPSGHDQKRARGNHRGPAGVSCGFAAAHLLTLSRYLAAVNNRWALRSEGKAKLENRKAKIVPQSRDENRWRESCEWGEGERGSGGRRLKVQSQAPVPAKVAQAAESAWLAAEHVATLTTNHSPLTIVVYPLPLIIAQTTENKGYGRIPLAQTTEYAGFVAAHVLTLATRHSRSFGTTRHCPIPPSPLSCREFVKS